MLLLELALCAVGLGTAQQINQPNPPTPPIDVLTHHYDHYRTGWNPNEGKLRPETVTPSTFGMIFKRTVDAQIYSQPLIAAGVQIPSQGMQTIVIVCTMHNSVYAFDADYASFSVPYWKVTLGPSIPASDYPGNDARNEIGILSTPVIDKPTKTLYLVTHNKIDGVYYEKLHALDITTGAEKPGSPVVIHGTAPGKGTGGDGTTVTFDPFYHMNRPALLLDHGRLYIAFGSHSDLNPYHGWVFAYNSTTLAQTGCYCTTGDGVGGGVWQSGGGLVSNDAGDVFFLTGNGKFSHDSTGKMTGNSMVKLKWANSKLVMGDFFTPHDSDAMNGLDQDLGCAGPTLIPNLNILVGAGKDGSIFAYNQASLGHFSAAADNNLQRLPFATHDLHSGFVYWNSPDLGPSIYSWPQNECGKRFTVSATGVGATPVSQTVTVPDYSGGMLCLSSRGSAAGTGILWVAVATDPKDPNLPVQATLRAFDATDLTHELWNSDMNAADTIGDRAKFVPPVVANGKVYLANFQKQLVVFGLKQSVGGAARPSSPKPR